MFYAGFLGWLLKYCTGSFFLQYSAYSQQVLVDCITAVCSLIGHFEQGRDKLTLVQPMLQAWSQILSPVLDDSHKVKSSATF